MSIFWTIQNITNRIGKIDLAGPVDLLGERENEIFRHYKVPKRRSEWLGARLVVKDLVLSVDPRFHDYQYHQIEVLNEPGGAPYLSVQDFYECVGKISLSHSHEHVFCAYSSGDIPLGVDLEWIEPRGMDMVADFFTPTEVNQVLKTGESDRSLLVTLVWSAKEAVLKAHSTGLWVDTRSVEILITSTECQVDGWNILSFNHNQRKEPSLRVFWRREDNFILSACLPIDYCQHLTRFNG